MGGDTNGDGAASAPAKGDWEQIYVGSTGTLNMTYATLRYGGNTIASYDAALALLDNGAATLDHVTIADSASAGIYAYAGTAGGHQADRHPLHHRQQRRQRHRRTRSQPASTNSASPTTRFTGNGSAARLDLANATTLILSGNSGRAMPRTGSCCLAASARIPRCP